MEPKVRIISCDDENGYDISAYDENGTKIHSAWAIDPPTAHQKARILANYYKDSNGQACEICNEIGEEWR